MKSKKLISIVSPCYNEQSNIQELYTRVVRVLDSLNDYEFEYLFIDNASNDATVDILKGICQVDSRVKVIINNRNYGHIRSPYWGLMQCQGVAAIYLASDLQDPPELIPNFIKAWENGYKVVLAVKPNSMIDSLSHLLRMLYYRFLDKISELKTIKDATGFGLYDRIVIDKIIELNDPYPYLRGLIIDLGYPLGVVNFNQPKRFAGLSKNNIYTLYDNAMLGIVHNSFVPIRLALFIGLIGIVAILLGLMLFSVVKIAFYNSISFFDILFYSSIYFMFFLNLFFMGFLAEYMIGIFRRVMNKPIVVERERINF